MDLDTDFNVLSNGTDFIAIRAVGATVEIWGKTGASSLNWRLGSSQTKASDSEARSKALDYIRNKINNGYRWVTSAPSGHPAMPFSIAKSPTASPKVASTVTPAKSLDRFELIELD